MKRILTLTLAAAMLLGMTSGASAVDFKVSGQWLIGFAAGESNLVAKENGSRTNAEDQFNAGQRFRTKIEAVASENLAGTVYFEIGDQRWGNNATGAAMGADGQVVEVKNAYLDWTVPGSDLKLRMGIQGVAMPDAAGGSAVLDADVAAVVASYQFNDNVGLTAAWMRPFNDNHGGTAGRNDANYLDNVDLFALTLPLTFDGLEITPWAMYGFQGKTARFNQHGWGQKDGDFTQTLGSYYSGMDVVRDADGNPVYGRTGKAYGSMFWVGLPVKVTALDPLNIEFDINYGYVEKMGRYGIYKRGAELQNASTKREGWIVKALVEYKMDWGTPGLFAWYASGDDGDAKNGSERLPTLNGFNGLTNFLGGADDYDWTRDGLYEQTLTLDGTWGVGAQIKDMSFVDDLTHTFRVAYWNGTNSPSMVRYMGSRTAWNENNGYSSTEGIYLTTNDALLEFNLVNTWQIYENLKMGLELGYVVNMIDKSTWKGRHIPGSFEKQDLWKASLVFAYSF